jgi:pimeloyl-ACP methyl ester carboxylesterase
VRWSFAAAAEARLVELARARLLETGSAVLAADLRACDAFDVAARLGEIGLPTLIIVGGDDRMTPPPLSEELRAGIAGARAEVIAGGGHMVMLERPEAIGRLLQSFLTDLSRSPNASAAAKGDKR